MTEDEMGREWHEYHRLRKALMQVPGTAYHDADHPAAVLRAALADNVRIWGWTGAMSNAQTGYTTEWPPLLTLLDTGEHLVQITVRHHQAYDRRGWDRGAWFDRAELLNDGIQNLRVFDDLLDMAMSMADPDSRPPHEQLRHDHTAVEWAALRLLSPEHRQSAKVMAVLRGRSSMTGFGADPMRPLFEQTVQGPVPVPAEVRPH